MERNSTLIVTLCYSLELPIRGLFFDMRMGLMAGCKSRLSFSVMGIELN